MPNLLKPFFVRPLPFVVDTVDSQGAAQPASHLQYLEVPGMVWGANGALNAYVELDLGAAKEFDFVAIISAKIGRFASMQIRTDVDNVFGAPLYNTNSATQLLENTDTIGGTGWSLNNATAAMNAALAPDGTMTATKVTDDAVNSFHRAFSSTPTLSLNKTHIASVFAKAGTLSWLRFQTTNEDGANSSIWFNLAAGTIGTIDGLATEAFIEDWGNGWYRCGIEYPSGAADIGVSRVWLNITTANDVSAHVGGSGTMYLWRANLTAIANDMMPATKTVSGSTTIGRIYFRDKNPPTDRTYYHSFHEFTELQNCRFIRLDLKEIPADFSAATVVIGKKIPATCFPNPGWEDEPEDLGSLSIGRFGVPDKQAGLKYRRKSFTLGWISFDDYERSFRAVNQAIGTTEPIFCCFDPYAASKRQDQCYLGWMRRSPVARGGKIFDRYSIDYDIMSMI